MGNKDTTPHQVGTAQSAVSDTTVLCEMELGEIIMSSRPGCPLSQILFYREIRFSNAEEMQNIYRFVQSQTRKQRDEICQLIDVVIKRDNQMCSSSYALQVYVEMSGMTMDDEIEARVAKDMDYFDFEDCCRIVNVCVEALKTIETQIMPVKGSLHVKNVLHRVFLHPGRIAIMPSGTLKIFHPIIVSPFDRFQYRHCCYYSPEKICDFDHEDDTKCAIFEFGITLLHIITLQDCHGIYNGFEVKEETIDEIIDQIWAMYHNQDLCQLLRKMTRVVRSKRGQLAEFSQHVKNMFDCEYLIQRNQFVFSKPLPPVSTWNIEPADQESNRWEELKLSKRSQKRKLARVSDKYNPTDVVNASSCLVTDPQLLHEIGDFNISQSGTELARCSYQYGRKQENLPRFIDTVNLCESSSFVDENANPERKSIVKSGRTFQGEQTSNKLTHQSLWTPEYNHYSQRSEDVQSYQCFQEMQQPSMNTEQQGSQLNRSKIQSNCFGGERFEFRKRHQ